MATATGTRDVHYDLVSVLYHTLQEAETIDRYIEDARSRGDDGLVEFFQEIQEDDRRRADRAKALLGERFDGEN